MAKIETTFIRPKEEFNVDTGKAKVTYDGYQNNPHELITEDGFAGALDTAMPTALAKAQVIEITWQELKDKRDNGQLIAGSLYRITDYNCTTTQENTQSANHQFDIVLLALSNNKLAEEGWAMMHDNIYDVTFADEVTKKCYIYCTSVEDDLWNVVEVDTMLGWDEVQGIEINEDTKTAIVGVEYGEGGYAENLTYNYFQNSNLSAWKVWYCLDNDKSRFAWADSGEVVIKTLENGTQLEKRRGSDIIEFNGNTYYQWQAGLTSNNSYTLEERPTINSKIYRKSGPPNSYIMVESLETIVDVKINETGRGVIYRLIDEWNIDYPCDFKNMQMLIPMDSYDNIDMQNPVTSKYCYAFTDNISGDPEDLSIKGHAINIKVKPNLIREIHSAMYFSPGTLFYTNRNDEQICIFSDVTVGIADTTIFINRGYAINILDGSSYVILKDCGNICIGYDSSNIMLDTVVNSTFGSNCENIQLVDEQDLNYGNNGVELATKEDLN